MKFSMNEVGVVMVLGSRVAQVLFHLELAIEMRDAGLAVRVADRRVDQPGTPARSPHRWPSCPLAPP